MKTFFCGIFLLLTGYGISQNLPMQIAHTYSTGTFNKAAAKAVAYDRLSKRLFFINQNKTRLEIIDYSDLHKPFVVARVDLSGFVAKATDVGAHTGIIAVVGESSSPQAPGKLLFYDEDGNYLRQFSVGSMPSAVGISPSGNITVVANEGAPDSSYTDDPAGTVSVLDISFGVNQTNQSDMQTINFQKLDTTSYDPLINVYGNNASQSPSLDLEPENIGFNSNSTKAYISLQENNALAIVDIINGQLDTVVGFGYKDYNLTGLDASDVAPNINIRTYNNLYGMYQPDGIAGFSHNSTEYIITANEGDLREYTAYDEARRMNTVPVDPADFPNYFQIAKDSLMGRLQISLSIGDRNKDGLYDSLFTFGGRSISIWNENGQLVWDSGDDFEQTLAQLHPANFNSDYDDNSSFKSRSDNRGPEPEAVVVGVVDSVRYAFISLKRMGGIMVYDLSDPSNPQFVMYELNRDFSLPASDPAAGDLGPSSLEFVPAPIAPLGIALIYVANEVSGNVTVYQLGTGIGLNEGYELPDIHLFPNPSSGVFKSDVYTNFKVYNSAGQLVKTVEDHNKIDLSNQADGYYIIRNEKGNALRVIKK